MRGPQIKPVGPAELAPPASRRGRRRKLTDYEVLELAAWMKARRALGNMKTKAAELGVSKGTLSRYLIRLRRGDSRGRGA